MGNITTVAIIGYGDFGKLLASLLPRRMTIRVIDINEPHILPTNVTYSQDITSVSGAEVVFLAIPYDAMPGVCKALTNIVDPNTIVADVCSVKIKPAQLLESSFGDTCRYIATHPLFGPNSAPDRISARGKQLAWSVLPGGGDVSELREMMGGEMGLKIVDISPDAHDREMAWVHALTFFVGRVLSKMSIPNLSVSTGYFEELLDLVRLDAKQSNELFLTVEKHNPYAASMRNMFIKKSQDIDSLIR